MASAKGLDISRKQIDVIHASSRRYIGDEIVFPMESLHLPTVEATPVIRQFSFWGGKGIPKSEYIPDFNFSQYRKRDYDGKTIGLNDIREPIDDKVCYRAIIIASAGEGKTTILKRYAKRTMENGIEQLKDVTLVFYMNFRDFGSMEKVTAEEFFCERFMSTMPQKQKESTFQWMTRNPEKLLFVIDGFDQAPWKFDKAFRPISYNNKEDEECIIYNLLAGYLFEKSRILISSRAYAVHNFPPEVRPEATMALTGFTEQDMKSLVLDICQEHGQRIWTILTHELLGLYSLCSTPMFLVFVLIVLLMKPDAAPDTLTAVVFELLLTLQRSEHSREEEEENFLPILHGLKRVAFRGTSEEKVLFTSEDFDECDCKLSDVKDLVMTCPERFLSRQRILELGKKAFFCHQSIQEALSALEIIELIPKEFDEFVEKNIVNSYWSVVFKFLSGALGNPVTLNTLTTKFLKNKDDLEAKREILLRHLIISGRKLQKSYKDAEKLEWISCVYECGPAIPQILTDFKSMELWKVDRTSSLFLICSLAKHLQGTSNFDIAEARANPAIAPVMEEASQRIKIRAFEISSSEFATDTTWKLLSDVIVASKVAEIRLNEWIPQTAHLQIFLENLVKVGYILQTLNISSNRTLRCPHLWHVFGRIVSELRCAEFSMRHCRPSAENLNALFHGLHGAKLTELEISDLVDLDDESWDIIGKVIGLAQTKELRMQGCHPTFQQCLNLQKSLAHAETKLQMIDFSWNFQMEPRCWSVFAKIIAQHSTEEVRFWKCQPTFEQLNEFFKALMEHPTKIQLLEIFDNAKMDNATWEVLGKIIVLCDTRILRMDGCNPTEDNLGFFKGVPGLENSKVSISGCIELQNYLESLSKTSQTFHDDKKTAKTIGPEGGAIAISGCSVIFPAGALLKETEITISVEKSDGMDDTRVPITPVLVCHPPGMRFHKPVRVQLYSWCFRDIRVPVHVETTVFRQQHDEKNWTEVRTQPLAFAGPIEFTSLHFTRFLATLRRIFSCAPIFRVKNVLTHDGNEKMVSSFYHDDAITAREVKDELAASGSEIYLSNTNTLKVKSDFKVKMTFSTDSYGIKIQPLSTVFDGEDLVEPRDRRSFNFLAEVEESQGNVVTYKVKLDESQKINNPFKLEMKKPIKTGKEAVKRGNLKVADGGVMQIQEAYIGCDGLTIKHIHGDPNPGIDKVEGPKEKVPEIPPISDGREETTADSATAT